MSITRTSVIARLAGLVFFGLVSAACDQNPDAPTSPKLPVSEAMSSLFGQNGRGPSRLIEQEFAAIARDEPDFAGYYYDGSNIVVRIKDLASRSPIESRVRSSMQAAGRPIIDGRGAPLAMRAELAQFRFADLLSWRDALRDSGLFIIPGVNMLDLDEVENRIAVGIEVSASQQQVVALARRLAISDSALTFVMRQPVQPTGVSLRDTLRPLQGGSEIMAQSGPGLCSITVPAYYPSRGQLVAITASHCSRTVWGPDNGDGGPIQQPWGANWPFFGSETHDEAGWSCWQGFGGWDQCRHAEVSAYTVGTEPIQRGRLASPSSSRQASQSLDGNEFPAVYQVAQGAPARYFGGAYNSVVVGQTMHKIGRRTGWTYGNVYRTCVDIEFQPNRQIMCADWAHLGVLPGDSGSPIFGVALDYMGDTTFMFIGMLSARDENTIDSHHPVTGANYTFGGVFSNYSQMQADMGTFYVY